MGYEDLRNISKNNKTLYNTIRYYRYRQLLENMIDGDIDRILNYLESYLYKNLSTCHSFVI